MRLTLPAAEALLRRALAAAGAGAPRLDRLEALEARLANAHARGAGMRATLAGALVDLDAARLAVRPAPPRRAPA